MNKLFYNNKEYLIPHLNNCIKSSGSIEILLNFTSDFDSFNGSDAIIKVGNSYYQAASFSASVRRGSIDIKFDQMIDITRDYNLNIILNDK